MRCYIMGPPEDHEDLAGPFPRSHLWWNNEDGWVDFTCATPFEVETLVSLPIGALGVVVMPEDFAKCIVGGMGRMTLKNGGC